MGSNGTTWREKHFLEANFQIPKIPGFPIHFAKNREIVPDFDKSYLGTRASFLNSVKSYYSPISQIWKYVQMNEFNFFQPDPSPYPLNQSWTISNSQKYHHSINKVNFYAIRTTYAYYILPVAITNIHLLSVNKWNGIPQRSKILAIIHQ